MGMNTVAVIFNDHMNLPGRRAEDIDEAILKRHRSGGRFGWGQVISTAHADYDQVVIVGRNTGQIATEVIDLSNLALLQMVECLTKHGYRVTKRRKAAS